MATLKDISDAIVYEINNATSGTFNRTFVAKVLWANRKIPLTESNVLRVDVCPIGETARLLARGRHQKIYEIHVGVRKRYVESELMQNGVIDDVEVSDLATLIEQLAKFFLPKQPNTTGLRLATIQEATFWGTDGTLEIVPVILWEHLETLKQFTGFFPLSVKVPE